LEKPFNLHSLLAGLDNCRTFQSSLFSFSAGHFEYGVASTHKLQHFEGDFLTGCDSLDWAMVDLHRPDPLEEVRRVTQDMNQVPRIDIAGELQDGYVESGIEVGNLADADFHN
jgi:hypothetical protein